MLNPWAKNVQVTTLAIVLVSIVGFISAFFLLLYGTSRGMRLTVKTFTDLLTHGDYSNAYTHLSHGLQKTVHAEDFEAFLANKGISNIKAFVNFSDFSIGSGSGSVAPILVRQDSGNAIKVHLDLAKENGQWRVSHIRTLQ